MPSNLVKSIPRKDFGDCRPHIGLALALLYGKPELYDQYRTRLGELMSILLAADPVDCEMQREVSRLFSRIDNIRLYVSLSVSRLPDYYISIKRVDGLWRMVSRRMSEVSLGRKRAHSGVVFLADVAFNAPILHSNVSYKLTRMLTGGTSIQGFIGDMEDPEVMRQISQCAVTAWWFNKLGEAPDFELPINLNPGRLTLGIHQDGIPTDYHITAWPWVAVSDKAHYNISANFQVLADVPNHTLPLESGLRCILPYIAGMQDWHDTERPVMGPRTEFAIAEILRHRIVPIVGYQVGAWVTLFGLGYDATTRDWAIQTFAEKRRAADINTRIPIIVRNTATKSIETNSVMTNCLAQTLAGENVERYLAARRCLEKLLAGNTLQDYHHWYTKYGTRYDEAGGLLPGGFTPEERRVLRERLGE